MRKQKTQISFAVTAKLISVFVFATRIVQFLFYLNPKFQASSSFLCLYRPVCVGPVRKPHCWFSHEAAHMITKYITAPIFPEDEINLCGPFLHVIIPVFIMQPIMKQTNQPCPLCNTYLLFLLRFFLFFFASDVRHEVTEESLAFTHFFDGLKPLIFAILACKVTE